MCVFIFVFSTFGTTAVLAYSPKLRIERSFSVSYQYTCHIIVCDPRARDSARKLGELDVDGDKEITV